MPCHPVLSRLYGAQVSAVRTLLLLKFEATRTVLQSRPFVDTDAAFVRQPPNETLLTDLPESR